MPNIKQFFSKTWPVLILIALWVVIVLTNYQPDTWLIGWDTLLPEFNFGLNIKRSLVGTWQAYQGLGITGGMAHNADLVRELLLAGLNLLIPVRLLRYAWHFLMLLLGPLGVYVLSLYLFQKNHKQSKAAALTAALFYLLNLAAVQYFFVPYEAFSSFYGFLPWMIYTFIVYLDRPNIKNLLLLALAALASSPAYYVQTLFVVMGICLVIFGLDRLKQSGQRLKQAAAVNIKGLGVVILVSFFWLLPVAYFTLTSAHNTIQSKQNLLSTPETRLQNAGSGSLLNIMTLKGYWFEYIDYSPEQSEPQFLLASWIDHVQQPVVVILGVVLFSLSALGLVLAHFKKKRQPWSGAVLGLLVLSVLMLTGGRGVLGLPFKLASSYLPLFGQIFRSSFTKWSMAAVLSLALGLGYALIELSLRIDWLKNKVHYLAAILSIGFIVIVQPVFQGQLIYDSMQLDVPGEYFALFDYLSKQDSDARIVHLPILSMWGWQFNDWGYRGSGFLWYGIQQPIVDRNFDVWSPANEQSYRELDFAVKNQDSEALKKVFNKYDLSYALFDNSIISPDLANTQEHSRQQRELIESAGARVEWQQGSLVLLELKQDNPVSIFEGPDVITEVDYEPSFVRQDSVYSSAGDYVLTAAADIRYPFFDISMAVPDETGVISLTKSTKGREFTQLAALGLSPGMIYAGPAYVSYQQERVAFKFRSPGSIKAGKTTVDLPLPRDFTMPVSEEIDQLGIDLNGQFITLQQGEEKEIWLEKLLVGKPLVLRYFNLANVEFKDNQIEVSRVEAETAIISSQIWSNVTQAQTQSLSATAANIELRVLTKPVKPELPAVRGVNCDQFERGSVETIFLDSGYQFKADDSGSLCLGIRFNGSNTRQDQWIALTGSNTEGRPLRFYVEHVGQRQVVLEDLTSAGKYQEKYFLPAFTNLAESSYSLNLNTRSFKEESAVNELSQVSFYSSPLSIDWLRQIKLQNQQAQDSVLTANVNNIDRLGTGIHRLRLDDSTDQKQWLVFSQSFDPAWIGVRRNNMFDFKLLPHAKYNGWANAWDTPAGSQSVILFYWPQFLEFIGFGSIIGVFFSLSIPLVLQKRKTRD